MEAHPPPYGPQSLTLAVERVDGVSGSRVRQGLVPVHVGANRQIVETNGDSLSVAQIQSVAVRDENVQFHVAGCGNDNR